MPNEGERGSCKPSGKSCAELSTLSGSGPGSVPLPVAKSVDITNGAYGVTHTRTGSEAQRRDVRRGSAVLRTHAAVPQRPGQRHVAAWRAAACVPHARLLRARRTAAGGPGAARVVARTRAGARRMRYALGTPEPASPSLKSSVAVVSVEELMAAARPARQHASTSTALAMSRRRLGLPMRAPRPRPFVPALVQLACPTRTPRGPDGGACSYERTSVVCVLSVARHNCLVTKAYRA
jgi:hypothetical protein